MSRFDAIKNSLVSCDLEQLTSLVKEELAAGSNANDILDHGLIAGMDVIGGKMESGEMFIPEVLMAAHYMSSCIDILKPFLADDEGSEKATIVIGTVKGDLHDIGKNLVSMMIKSTGFDVIDLGVDVEPGEFVAAIDENKPDIVAISALLTTTMPMMEETVNTINKSDLRSDLKIIVGGAPVNQDFADKIGADGYAPDAGSASRLVKSLIN